MALEAAGNFTVETTGSAWADSELNPGAPDGRWNRGEPRVYRGAETTVMSSILPQAPAPPHCTSMPQVTVWFSRTVKEIAGVSQLFQDVIFADA